MRAFNTYKLMTAGKANYKCWAVWSILGTEYCRQLYTFQGINSYGIEARHQILAFITAVLKVWPNSLL